MPNNKKKKAKASSDNTKAKNSKSSSATSYQDATYTRQLAYYNKIRGDYGAEETRKRGDISKYYGSEANPGTKEKVTKTTVVKKKNELTDKEKARISAMKKRIDSMKKGKDRKDLKSKLKTYKSNSTRAGYNPFTKDEKKRYEAYSKVNPEYAERYKRNSTADKTEKKTENVYDTKTVKQEIKKKVYDKKKMSDAQKRRYQKLVAKGDPNKAGKKARKFKNKSTRGDLLGTIGTGKFKNVVKRSQRYRTVGKRNATEGLYQRQLRETRSKDLNDIKDDYAARGVLRSGMYAGKTADYDKEFGKQLGELNSKKKSSYSQLSSERRTFNREQELQKEQARLEAIRRRAARTGSFL